MFRRVAVAASAVALSVAAVVAMTRGGASYTVDDVVKGFNDQGYALVKVPPGEDNPLADRPEGTFLFPKPVRKAPFYVFVARNDLFAKQFFAPLAEAGGGPGVFDLLQGNVVVSSDASLTQEGLTPDERRRIRAAMQSLDEPR